MQGGAKISKMLAGKNLGLFFFYFLNQVYTFCIPGPTLTFSKKSFQYLSSGLKIFLNEKCCVADQDRLDPNSMGSLDPDSYSFIFATPTEPDPGGQK